MLKNFWDWDLNYANLVRCLETRGSETLKIKHLEHYFKQVVAFCPKLLRVGAVWADFKPETG